MADNYRPPFLITRIRKVKIIKTIFSNEQLQFIKDNYDKISYKEIGEILGFTERQIRGKINGLGLSKLRKFNNRYFKSITSPNQAYWLGFIYADGYIIKNEKNRNYELGIELIDSDVDLLNDFNKELGGVHTVSFKQGHKDFNGYSYDTKSCLIRIYSKSLILDLINLSVLPNKTNEVAFPTCDNYFWDFLRGFIDGDGCIHVTKQKYIRLHLVNSNVDFLNYLRNTIEQKLNVGGSIYKEKDKKYQLDYFRQKDVKLILDKIYENVDCQYLKRKYEKYKSYYGSPA